MIFLKYVNCLVRKFNWLQKLRFECGVNIIKTSMESNIFTRVSDYEFNELDNSQISKRFIEIEVLEKM